MKIIKHFIETMNSVVDFAEFIISGHAYCFNILLNDVWSFYDSDEYHGMPSMVEWCKSFHEKSTKKML